MRHKQQPIGDFAGRDFKHGLNGYKVYACRCEVCRSAMSAYGKARYVPMTPTVSGAPTRSWWLDVPQSGFSDFVEREQLPRMRMSTLGRTRNRAISSEELSQ